VPEHPEGLALISAARRLAPLAAAHAARGEADRCLRPPVVEALRSAGFSRYFVPARWGGSQGSFTAYAAAVAEVARADPSAGWCASLAAATGRLAAFLPEPGQHAAWSQGPDALIVGALLPAGQAERARGGWVLRGRWPFVSSLSCSDLALVSCGVPRSGAGAEIRMFLLRRGAYEVHATWDSVGMCATGTDTLVLAEPAFVPDEHTVTRDALLAGRADDAVPACHAVPLRSASGLTFTSPILGAAEGALAAGAEAAARACGPAAEDGFPDSCWALESALERGGDDVAAARHLLLRAARDADEGVVRSPAGAVRAQRNQVAAAELLVRSVNRLLRAAGAQDRRDDAALQRFCRDANCALNHPSLQWGPVAEAYAASVGPVHGSGG
jgi:alkylation response protein AidB-like acyl-CoA dehydrogenase